MKIKEVFDIAKVECQLDSSDISDENLLVILNENIKEFLSILQSKKSEEFFAVTILNDLLPWQYEYWKLEYLDNWKNFNINKVLKVRFKWKNIPRVDVLEIDKKNISEVCYGISWKNLFIFHKEKEILLDAIELIWLTDIWKVESIEENVEDIFWDFFDMDSRILKLWLKSFLYEKTWNFNVSLNARNEYLKEMKNFINRIWRIKEPIEKQTPDLRFYS